MIQRLYDARKHVMVTRDRAKFNLAASKEQVRVQSTGESSPGRLLAIDLGSKRVGVAVCDELRITVRPLGAIPRGSWKDLLARITEKIEGLEAGGLVIGLPLNMDGSSGPAAANARNIAEKFRLSLSVPVYLQDERLTSNQAASELRASGKSRREVGKEIDSAAAAIILHDFIEQSRSEKT